MRGSSALIFSSSARLPSERGSGGCAAPRPPAPPAPEPGQKRQHLPRSSPQKRPAASCQHPASAAPSAPQAGGAHRAARKSCAQRFPRSWLRWRWCAWWVGVCWRASERRPHDVAGCGPSRGRFPAWPRADGRSARPSCLSTLVVTSARASHLRVSLIASGLLYSYIVAARSLGKAAPSLRLRRGRATRELPWSAPQPRLRPLFIKFLSFLPFLPCRLFHVRSFFLHSSFEGVDRRR